MRELLLIDLNMPETDETYLDLLGLSRKTEVIRLGESRKYDCGKAERAVFLPNFTGGPYPYQVEQVRGNPGVGSWIVLAQNADRSVLRQYRIMLQSRAGVFTDVQQVRDLLQRKAVPRDSCLILAVGACAGAEMLAGLMKACLSTWTIRTAQLSEHGSVEAALDSTPSSRMILLGERASDFDDLTWPKSMHPFVLLLNDEDGTAREQAEMIRSVTIFMPGIDKERVFVANLRGEQWRLEIQRGLRSAGSMAAEPMFCMKDDFGLPAAMKAYQDEAAIQAYMARYCVCEALAAKMQE